ncbi:MAG: hypothetical protein ACI8ZB_000696 [Desulforhopalus sp.]|jgi:hypothetical protein
MNSKQKLLIQKLMKTFAASPGTEAAISFVASKNGLLLACQELLKDLERKDRISVEWVRAECEKHSMTRDSFSQQLSQIVALFNPTENITDYFLILGLEVGAGQEEIKKQYRKLSLRYHPDTATGDDPDASERFMQITRAYHALTGRGDGPNLHVAQSPASKWGPKQQKTPQVGRQKKVFLWAFLLVILLLIFTTVASNIYKKKAMLAGLQESSGAFVPPSTKHANDFDTGSEKKITLQPNTVKAEIIENQLGASKGIASPSDKKIESETNDTLVNKTNDLVVDSELSDLSNTLSAITKKGGRPDQFLKKEIVLLARVAEKKSHNVLKKKQSSKRIDEKEIKNTSLKVEAVDSKSSGDGLTQKEDPPVDQGVITTQKTRKSTDPKMQTITSTVDPQVKTDNDNQLIIVEAAKEKEASVSAPQMVVRSNSDEPPEEVDLQEKIDTFLNNYIRAYEQRNLILFSRFFEVDAVENGKFFTTMLPTYMDLFATTSNLKMDLTVLAWTEVDSGVSIDGRFKVGLLYTDKREIHGSGAIHFILLDNNGEFRIKSMEYEFDR